RSDTPALNTGTRTLGSNILSGWLSDPKMTFPLSSTTLILSSSVRLILIVLPPYQAIPASTKKFKSENNKPDLTSANFSGPVNGIRTSKLPTAILDPDNSENPILPVTSTFPLSYPRIKYG